MKKTYEPLPMIMNGRYAVLFGKLSEKEKEDTLARMATLIEEERYYEDKGNYGHFCNILPTIAIDEALRRNGKRLEEAFELISTHMWAALTPEAFRKMSRFRFFLPVMKKVIPLGFKYGSGKGWKYVWHKDDPAMLKCFFEQTSLFDITFTDNGNTCVGLWNLGELTTISARNMDYSSEEEILRRRFHAPWPMEPNLRKRGNLPSQGRYAIGRRVTSLTA